MMSSPSWFSPQYVFGYVVAASGLDELCSRKNKIQAPIGGNLRDTS